MTNANSIRDLGPVPVGESQRFSFVSRVTGLEFAIDVALPPPFLPGDGPWPVLIVTDGNMAFPTTASTAAILPIEPGGPRPVCVVGIGYPPAGEGEEVNYLALRNRDLTPVRVEEWEERMRAAPPPFTLRDGLETGGGEQLLDFIADELLPWLQANFPVDADDCTFAGSSIGGALVLHALFTRPGMFARHLAISPSLWWGGRYLFDLEEAYANAHGDLASKLYLCVGGAEEVQAPEVRMVSDLADFAKRLESRCYSSLEMKHEVLAGETHVSVFNAAISNGLRQLHGAKMYENGNMI